MKYRPYWQRILFLAIIFNVILFLGGSSIFSNAEIKETPPENLQEIEWIETEETATVSQNLNVPATETFSVFEIPPLEIQRTEFEPLPELNLNPTPPPLPQPVEKISEPEPENKPEPETKTEPPEEKSEENSAPKLKVIAKVFPKDLIEQLTASGAIREKIRLNAEKIVLSATITTEGKVRNAEILSGGDGALVDLVSKTAVQSWIFEPYLDADGNPQELNTQIEFTPEDF